ncbi:hypothetical protein AMTRI_Chr02g224270 [Amborella trichopoda]|uniref:Methyltransferase type 11 domain-containing protein n=1 Tax=Amborella trichopoda TaxID=13333 RepID=W1P2S2_AMBTC|nr:methyltransferase-like protein 13 [Amborella trichopoda]ERN01954.1 hypothetical protein AMTR_s00045p00050880 [Amborella trichopoda]|eukprot:XP_006840279.1 methyltransferase-like protein 13 [Amborella trichopoda]
MTNGGSTQAYGEPWYWDKRYKQDPGPFDWYQKYPALAPIFNLYLKHNHRILITGCGNAALGEDMVNDGYQDIVNIDISSVVIEAMRKKYRNCPQLKYMEMDVRRMNDFCSGSFDSVIDKGMLDSLMCGQNSQNYVRMMLKEVGRVLKDNGVYILVTYGAPRYRLSLLKEICLWTVKLHVIEKPGHGKFSEHPTGESSKTVPLNDDGSSATDILGENPDVHYVFICVKDKFATHEKEIYSS